MEPMDYTSAFNGVLSPYQAMMQGVQGGAAIQQLQQQQAAQQAQLAQARQMQADLNGLSQNPTPDAIGAMILKYPSLAENLKRGADVVGGAQKAAFLDHAGQVYAAIRSGKPDIAQSLLADRATALRNSGDETGAKATEQMAQQLKDNPQGAELMTGMHLAAAIGPEKFAETFGKLGSERRADDEEPAKIAEGKAKAAGEQADATQKQLGVIGSTLGALQGKNAKPAQAIAALNSMAARGIIGKDELPVYLASVPTDPKALDSWLGQVKMQGMKPDEQMKYTTPDANAQLSAETQRRGQNIQHDQWVQEQEDANSPGKPNEALAQRIASYKQPGLGQFALNKPWGQATMDRVAELNPTYDAAVYPARAAAVRSFSSGKDGAAVESANTALNHLDTLRELALAQKNGDTRLFNRIANRMSSEFGGAAPTNLKAAVMMAAPEVVKAVSGAGGTGEDRAHAAEALSGNGSYSPDQVLGAIGTTQELFAGRLKEKKRTYERATKMNDFEDTFLSPAAQRILGTKKDKAAAGAGEHPSDIDVLLNKYGDK
jgi:hypothetical protein